MNRNFLSMMQSLDAFFPVGAFTLSNGLEDYVLTDCITSSAHLKEYISGFLSIFAWQDLGALHLAYHFYDRQEELLALDERLGAIKVAREPRIGSHRMCARFIKAHENMNDAGECLLAYQKLIAEKRAKGYHPIALGIYGAQLNMDEDLVLGMYSYSVLSAIVNNAVKLVPLSQMDGQRILFQFLEQIEETNARSKNITMDTLGISGAAYETHCMHHEQLYSRQYMS